MTWRSRLLGVVVASTLAACASPLAPTSDLTVDDRPVPQTLDDEALVSAPRKPVEHIRQRIVDTAQSYRGTRGGLDVGEGQFIHPPSIGGTARIESVEDPEWRTHFLGARHILPG